MSDLSGLEIFGCIVAVIAIFVVSWLTVRSKKQREKRRVKKEVDRRLRSVLITSVRRRSFESIEPWSVWYPLFRTAVISLISLLSRMTMDGDGIMVSRISSVDFGYGVWCEIIKIIFREIEEQNRIDEMEARARRSSSSDSSISEVDNTVQYATQVDFGPPGSKNVSIPMAGDAGINSGFQSTDDLWPINFETQFS